MNFKELESQFWQLKGKRSAGAISEDDFRQSITELRLQDENQQWWHWARELGRQCLLGHQVFAFVFCRWPLPKRDASPLAAIQRFREDLGGPLRFSEVYLIGNLNQIN